MADTEVSKVSDIFKPDDILEKIRSTGIKVETEANQSQVSLEQGSSLIKAIAKHNKSLSEENSFIGLCIISQKGGTSKRANGNIYAIVGGHKLTLAFVRDIAAQEKIRFTLKQWARTYATKIANISEYFDIPGDLYKKIARNHPEIDSTQLYWLSNFQMDNPDCDETIRGFIKEHFNDLFPKS